MRTTLTALAAAAALTLTGCTTTPPQPTPGTTAPVTTTTDAATGDPVETFTTTPGAGTPTAAIAPMDGTTVRDIDGVKVTITRPKRVDLPVVSPDPTAVAVGFIVQVVNATGMDVEAGNVNVLAYVGAAGHEAPLTFAVEQGYPGGFTGTIPAGATRTAGYAWTVAAADLSVIEAQVGTVTSTSAPAIFRGSVTP